MGQAFIPVHVCLKGAREARHPPGLEGKRNVPNINGKN
jgi:hypothetical protein